MPGWSDASRVVRGPFCSVSLQPAIAPGLPEFSPPEFWGAPQPSSTHPPGALRRLQSAVLAPPVAAQCHSGDKIGTGRTGCECLSSRPAGARALRLQTEAEPRNRTRRGRAADPLLDCCETTPPSTPA